MKKLVLIAALGIVLLSWGFTKYYLKDLHISEISYDQIAETLYIEGNPQIPAEWSIKSIEKYDDGFTSPQVIISYTNDIKLWLGRSNSHYPNWKSTSYYLSGKPIKLYEKGNKIAIVFKHGDISYNFNSVKKSKAAIDSYIVKLLDIS